VPTEAPPVPTVLESPVVLATVLAPPAPVVLAPVVATSLEPATPPEVLLAPELTLEPAVVALVCASCSSAALHAASPTNKRVHDPHPCHVK